MGHAWARMSSWFLGKLTVVDRGRVEVRPALTSAKPPPMQNPMTPTFVVQSSWSTNHSRAVSMST